MRSPSLSSPGKADQLIDIWEREVEVEYRGERYRVRDNGSAHRLPQKRQKTRPLDDQWTFGRQGLSTGYMYLSGVPVHRIVCWAFHGEPPTDRHVVDHIDTNRANNRPENLRWVTRLGRVDKRDSQGGLNVIQAGICDGDQLGTRPDVGRGVGVS